MTTPHRKPNPHFFERDPGGSVRLRIRLNPDDASLIEEAAGEVPLVAWIQSAVAEVAQQEVDAARKLWPTQPPPNPDTSDENRR